MLGNVKWESLLARSMEIGADYIATGHYARVEQLPNGRYAIRHSATWSKDQTYALYNLTQDQLRRTLMPVGEYEKDQIREIASAGEFDEFDLNEFFAAKGEGDVAEFKHRDEAQKWLDLLRGGFSETTVDMLKMGARKAAHAVLRFPVEEHPDAHVLVHVVRRVPLCDGELVE